MALTLRPVQEADRALLLRIYASTREEELRSVPWTAEEKAAFVAQQFEAQDRHYRTHLGDVSYDVVEHDGEAIGRLYIGRWPGEVHVVDIALLDDRRGCGHGTELLTRVIAEAERAGKKVTINVERFNRARALYERLGFVEVDASDSVYILMERSPAGT